MRLRRLLLALLAGACSGTAGTPEGAVRAVEEAARDGNVDEVVKRLGPRTRVRLAADARRAGELAGRRPLELRQLVAVGWTPPRFRLEGLRVVERAGDRAVVEAIGRHGERERLEVVREPDGWKLELP